MTAGRARRPLRLLLTASLLASTLSVTMSACAPPPTATPLVSTLDVLGPDPQFVADVNNGRLPAGWIRIGSIPKGTVSAGMVARIPALRIAAGGHESFALIRRTRASLLATPYLSWAWDAQPPEDGPHPVRLIVGLAARSKPEKASWWHFGETDEPQVDRIISIVWNGTALGRGTVIGPERIEDRPEQARYIARGGPEQGDRWWIDTVDLSAIHHQVWPQDDPTQMDIRFIGVAVRSGLKHGVMNIATIRLTH